MRPVLQNALLFGLCSYFVVQVVRRLPVIEDLALSGRRPFACDVCMSFWSAAMLAIVWYALYHAFSWVTWLGAAGMCFALLTLGQGTPVTLPPPPRPPTEGQ